MNISKGIEWVILHKEWIESLDPVDIHINGPLGRVNILASGDAGGTREFFRYYKNHTNVKWDGSNYFYCMAENEEVSVSATLSVTTMNEIGLKPKFPSFWEK